ncbi:putative bifunctional diguanylate cyclase/phosphodiesterase [Thiohalophilus thiocyanatoxydans]|uniref:cyclic-guanylate-specific phosphodiesterase n=1 Tax=Thiohalophilus thiocyanatoxydans TaxID=381308 RepID=A0A4R8J165_9GAMM|nr:bifunctional diguanylate cyclase/phosphodiesterase [Thiohalophilus thiocyanatoxydans]TDY03919.1 diguanylate cyclase (GGDEF)-like protein [Thiohalophilus thiocyanatoxydans]
MNFGRHWWFLIYLVVLGLGSVLSFYIYQQSQSMRDEILRLSNEDITHLHRIADLKQAVTAREPILYRYYTDTDRHSYQSSYNRNTKQINDGIDWLTDTFPDNTGLGELQNEHAALQKLAEKLDQVLTADTVDWDEARRILGDVAAVSRSLNNRLERFVRAVERQVVERGEYVSRATQEMFYSVVAVSVVFFILALFFGHYAYQHLSDARARRLLALFPERNPNPVFQIDTHGKVLFANPAAYNMQSVIFPDTRNLEALLPPNIEENISALRSRHAPLMRFEYQVATYIFFCTLQYLEDFDTCHVYLQDITARRTAEDRNEFLAYHDPLTGLANRRQLEKDVSGMLQQTAPGNRIAVAIANIDRFSMVSESLGHLAGDELITAVASRLEHCFSQMVSDNPIRIYRLEGDHFVILAKDAEDSFSDELSEQLQRASRDPVIIDNRTLSLSMSVGLAYFPEHGKDIFQLLKNAESAMRRISNQGGNGVCVYQSEMNADALLRLELSHDLRQAAEQNELLIYYQPKINLINGNLIGAEALVRWQHPQHGMISPAEFIPLAEETGSIGRIGEWILRAACARNRQWQTEGYPPQSIAVNLSARQFNRELPKQVAQILRDTGLEAKYLELEITEGIAMSVDSSIDIMRQLRELGVKLAIDDFGTGFSSLTYLKQFPIQTLKIDQSFVKQLEHSLSDRAIVRSIIELGHHLELDIVAEGVETVEQKQMLEEYRCDTMQGYLFSRPVPADEYEKFLITPSPGSSNKRKTT